jgi:hypothetical protein
MLVAAQIYCLFLIQALEIIIISQLMLGRESETANRHNLAINIYRSYYIGQSVYFKEVQGRHFYLLLVL